MRLGTRIVAVALALALIGTLLVVPQDSVLAAPADDADMLELINAARQDEALAPLVVSEELLAAAEAQTDAQMAAGTIFHTSDLGSVATGWQLLGENVGVGPSMAILHDAFMASPGHRANVLGDFNQVAISAKQAESGQFYVTLIFMQKPLPEPSTSGTQDSDQIVELVPGDIADIVGTTFEGDIEWLAEEGIAIACDGAGSLYCPAQATTRGAMATMMARALDLPASAEDHFVDDNGSPHEDAINAMAAAGITLGCHTPSSYCPDQSLTRAQMASFFVRALDLTVPDADFFSDDGNSIHEPAINALAEAEITLGCNPPLNDEFCGSSDLSRGHIAAFIRRALG